MTEEAYLPARSGRESLQPHLKEAARCVPRRVRQLALATVAPAAAAAGRQARTRGIQQVPRGLHEVHLGAVRQQQLLRHPAHARAAVCPPRCPRVKITVLLLFAALLHTCQKQRCPEMALYWWPCEPISKRDPRHTAYVALLCASQAVSWLIRLHTNRQGKLSARA